MFMSSFYARRSQKHKELLDLSVFFALLGSVHVKAARKMLVKLTSRRHRRRRYRRGWVSEWVGRFESKKQNWCFAEPNEKMLCTPSTNERRVEGSRGRVKCLSTTTMFCEMLPTRTLINKSYFLQCLKRPLPFLTPNKTIEQDFFKAINQWN